MILNLLNLYTLIFALFGKVNAMTTRLAVMKANISQQGLNLADLLLDQTSSSTVLVMTTPIFNATWESSAYYNVTDPILFILNATESPGPILLDNYSSTSTQPTAAVAEEEDDDQDDQDIDLTGTCFQIMVDCSALETTTDPPPPITTTTAGPAISEEDELIYDEEDYETVPERLKRQVLSLLDQTTTTANPLRTTPQSIGRLLDSLNSILRNLKRNTTLRIPFTTLPFSTSSSTESGGGGGPSTTTTSPATADRMMESTASSTPELLDDLIRWHTAGLILTTEEEDYDQELADNSSSASIFEAFNQTNPADDFIVNQDNETTTSQLPEETTTTTTVRAMCPLVVCPWNDTVGYFSSLTTTTNLPSSSSDGDDESNGTTLPCRGDNPQGCTPFWTSSRDGETTITSFHSSVAASTTPASSNGIYTT